MWIDEKGGWDSDRKTSKGGRASIEPNRGLASGIAGGVINVPPPPRRLPTLRVTDTRDHKKSTHHAFVFLLCSLHNHICACLYI